MQTPRVKHLLFIFFIAFGFLAQASSQKYFQQEVKYTIRVALHDKSHELQAFETITYTNNSPDTLSFLLFHLWPNAYSGNNTALAEQLLRTKGK
jgi:hypothetical protein